MRRTIFIVFTLCILKTFTAAQENCFAALLPSVQGNNIMAVATSQTAASTQSLLDSKNSAVLAAQSSGSAVTGLTTALESSAAGRANLNLLYGTSFKSSGPSTAYDRTTLQSITTQAGYGQSSFLSSLAKTASLYKAVQALSASDRRQFNQQYKIYLQPAGSPSAADRKILFQVTSASGYDQSKVLKTGNTTPVVQNPAPTPSSGGLFSKTSFWNETLSSSQALNQNSTNLVKTLVSETKEAAPWMNTKQYSTPYYVVDSKTPKVSVSIVQNGKVLTLTLLNTDSHKGVPVPQNAIPAAGTDGHITIYDKSTDTLYEYWQLKKVNDQWQASWGGILYNASISNGVMPVVTNAGGGKEYWGATATGLPAIGGTILLSELKAGKIPHVLALAIPQIKNTFVSPAERTDGTATGANAIPAGERFKFPSTIQIDPSWSPLMKMMVQAVRDYGLVIRDTAGSVTFYGEDPTQYGGDPYNAYYGGKSLTDVMKEFPWSALEALA